MADTGGGAGYSSCWPRRGGGGQRQPRASQIAQNTPTIAAPAQDQPAATNQKGTGRPSLPEGGRFDAFRRQQHYHIRSNVQQRGALNPRDDEPAIPHPTCLAPPRSPVAAGVEPPPHPGARGWKQKRRSAPVPAVVTGARAEPAGMRTAWWDAGHDAGDSCTALWCCVAGRSSFLVTTGARRILWICLRRFTAHRPICGKSQYTCCWMSGGECVYHVGSHPLLLPHSRTRSG